MSFSSARLCSIYNPKSIIPDTNFLGVHVPFSLDTQSFTTEHTIHRNAPSRPSRHHITFPFSPNRSAGWAGKHFTDNDKAEHTAVYDQIGLSFCTFRSQFFFAFLHISVSILNRKKQCIIRSQFQTNNQKCIIRSQFPTNNQKCIIRSHLNSTKRMYHFCNKVPIFLIFLCFLLSSFRIMVAHG